jgi:ferrous iron transport protein A
MADAAYALNGLDSIPLGQARRGFSGRLHAIVVTHETRGLTAAELEARLIELGFVEGAYIEVLHEGTFGADPIAVRVNSATVALRRREAMAILVT